MRRGFFAGLAAASVVVALVACSPSAEPDEQSSIRIANYLLTDWDPSAGAHVLFPAGQAVYDSLFMVDTEGAEPEPWLAEEWELSDDAQTLEVKLREDVDFIDGTHLDAEGIEKVFDWILASDTYNWKPRIVDQFGTEVTATGEYTIEITTTQPINYRWFWQFNLTPVPSPAAIDDPSVFADGPVGSGPYLIDEIVPDVSISFVRNPDYWNPEAYPYDQVTLEVFSDPVASLNALKTDQLDAAALTIPLAVEAEASGLQIVRGPGVVQTLVVLDRQGLINPAFADVRVRQAMNYAFDQPLIEETLDLGFGRVSSQPFEPNAPEYVEGGDDAYPYNLEKARELMAEAGYPDGFDVVIPTSAAAGTPAIEPIVQTTLAEIGIRVTYEPAGADLPEIRAAWQSGTYPLALLSMPVTNWLVWMTQPGVLGPVDDAYLEEQIEIAATGVPEEAAEASEKVGEYLLEEAWFVPFSRPSSVFATTPDVQIELNASGNSFPKLYQYKPAG